MFRLIFFLRTFFRIFSTISAAKESAKEEAEEHKGSITSIWPQRILNITLGYKCIALSVMMGEFDMFGLIDTEDTRELLAFFGISLIMILFGYFLSYAVQSLEKTASEKQKNEQELAEFNKKYRLDMLARRKKRIDSNYIHDI